MEHTREVVYFKKPIFCAYCSDYIWGVYHQAIKCSTCYRCFHPACIDLCTTPCDHQPLPTSPPSSPSPIPLSSWTVADVGDWMAVVNLHRYYELFRKKEVDGKKLEGLDTAQIEQMNLKDRFHIDSIFIAIQVLKEQPTKPSDAVTSEIASSVTSQEHVMSLYSFTSLQTCHVCGSHLLGIIQQGYQCKMCGLCCHRRCKVLLLPSCKHGCAKKEDNFIKDSSFGKSLCEFCIIPPPIVTLCTKELQKRASNGNEKLWKYYGQTPNTNHVADLKSSLIQHDAGVFAVSLSNHLSETIGGIVKKLFRDLPESLIPESFYSDFIALIRETSTEASTRELLGHLPPPHYLTLEHLLHHLSLNKDTKDLEKLARIFSNIMLRPPWHQIMDIVHNSQVQFQTIKHLLEQQDSFFTPEQHERQLQRLQPHGPLSRRSSSSILANETWYHGDITRDEVDDLMMAATDGTFLVRNASCWDPAEPYTLTLRKNGSNRLIKVSNVRGMFGLLCTPPLFNSMRELINHYTTHSLISIHRSLNLTLQHPLTREIPEQHSNVDLQIIRAEFKDVYSKSTQLMEEMEVLNSKQATLADLLRVYETNIEAFNGVLLVYNAQIEISKEFVKQKSCTQEMKQHAQEGQKKMERRKQALCHSRSRVQEEEKTTKESLCSISAKLDEMKEQMVLLDEQKEAKKRTLLRLNESELNIEVLQSGGEVKKNMAHNKIETWLVEGCRDRANELLKGRPKGTFLIRPKADEDNHALSIVSQKEEVVHVIINRTKTGYGFTEPFYIHHSLLDLVLHYKDTTLKEHNEYLDVTLDHPVFA